ncbi:hypothetical protein SAMN04487949_2655 [Halogranum gelatinilyticum]|uniref:Uncharacterized protein n=1 Tax=Halogranum gelatinilyticum TaxID=660521 RepID=A0A1G9W873_9EURY|nr:hypothetical protein [Halogranum gelatinilyticum]SDM80738.1 hypothetical protein SAMN04487949_2655 [Halogranum gelatinilyticum]
MNPKPLVVYGVGVPLVVLALGYGASSVATVAFPLFLLATFGVGVVCTALLFGAESHVQTAAYSAEVGGSGDPSVYDDEPPRSVKLGLSVAGLTGLSLVALVLVMQL